jgi:hypothetical protein
MGWSAVKRLRVLFSVWSDLLTAGLRKWTAEVEENTKSLPDREYWRGYGDGVRDARELPAARRRDEASGTRQPYPNE